MPRRVTLVAGRGGLVPYIAEAIRRRGDALQVVDIVGGRSLEGIDVAHRPLSAAAELVKTIKDFGPTHLVLAGGVHISDAERRGLAQAFGAAGRIAGGLGDVGLAGVILFYCRAQGYKLVGVHEVAPELLAPEGPVGGPPMDEEMRAIAAYGLKTARAVGAIDLGQSVIVSANRPLAAEDAGGTGVLLARVAKLRADGLIGDDRGRLVLAKARKPRQPSFVDLPAIGSETVVQAAAAGISAIVVEAKGSLLLDRAEIEREAAERGITVVGMRLG